MPQISPEKFWLKINTGLSGEQLKELQGRMRGGQSIEEALRGMGELRPRVEQPVVVVEKPVAQEKRGWLSRLRLRGNG